MSMNEINTKIRNKNSDNIQIAIEQAKMGIFCKTRNKWEIIQRR